MLPARAAAACLVAALLADCHPRGSDSSSPRTGDLPEQAPATVQSPSLGEGVFLVWSEAERGLPVAPPVARQTEFLTLTSGQGSAAREVTIRSKLAAGCALWSWVWGGFEFVNVHDYGRQIQTAFVADGGTSWESNPTEAGSAFSTARDPARWQGSRCIRAVNETPFTQITLAIPLEYSPVPWGGGESRPLLWKEVRLGKEITLNYLDLGPVAKYTSVVRVPRAIPTAGIEIPSLYLHASLKRFYEYDAATRTLRLQDPGARAGGALPPSGFGGIIATRVDGSRAFGQYGVTADAGGSVGRAGGFSFFRFPGFGTGGPQADATVKIRALHRGLTAGDNRMTTYLISGTLQGVRALMDSLYAHRDVAR